MPKTYYINVPKDPTLLEDRGVRLAALRSAFSVDSNTVIREATPEECAAIEAIETADAEKIMESYTKHSLPSTRFQELRAAQREIPYEQSEKRVAELQALMEAYVKDVDYRSNLGLEEADALFATYKEWLQGRRYLTDPGHFLRGVRRVVLGDDLFHNSLSELAFLALVYQEHMQRCPVDRDTDLGTFELTKTVLHLSDPCYSDVESGITVKKALPGTWSGKLRYAVGWGLRPYYVGAFHSTYAGRIPTTPAEIEANSWERLKGSVGVDSGQAGIYDMAHYRDDKVIIEDPKFSRGDEEETGERWYGANCDRTCGDDCKVGAGIIPHGVVSSSGDGDGGYAAYVKKNEDRQVVGVIIDFKGTCSGEE